MRSLTFSASFLFLLLSYHQLVSQKANVSLIKATGTGQTTGHIANITVQNTGEEPLLIVPQIFFIPSGGTYQPYIGHIPEGISVPPGDMAIIPVGGYCTDVGKPAVPSGTSLPPVSTWIPVDEKDWLGKPVPGTSIPSGGGTPFVVIDRPPVKTFDPTSIPGITADPGFNPVKPTTPPGGITSTWPGTDIPVGGTFTPSMNPEHVAPVLVDALNRIAKTFDDLRAEGIVNTPFSGDPEKERESVIQQTFWIYTSGLDDKKYEKKDFTDRVYDQFQSTTSKSVTSLPPDQKEDIDNGIADFWNTFQATGVEAKVLSEPKGTTTDSDTKDDQYYTPEGDVLISDENCACDTVKFTADLQTPGILGPNSEKIQFNSNLVKVPGTNRSEQRIIVETSGGIAAGEEFKLVIRDLKTLCKKCTKSKGCTPKDVTVSITYGELNDDNSSSAVKTASVTSQNGAYEASITMPEGTRNLGFFIKINYKCTDAVCKEVTCDEKLFLLKVKRKGKCACKETYFTPKVTHTPADKAKKKSEEEFTFTGAEYTWPQKVAKDDIITIGVDKEYIKAECEGCGGACKPEDFTYKIYGENISGLESKEETSETKYNPAKTATLVNKKKITGDTGDAVFNILITHYCEAPDCRVMKCEKTFTIRFQR